jgi:hypothetical protein
MSFYEFSHEPSEYIVQAFGKDINAQRYKHSFGVLPSFSVRLSEA